jgi:hypothetical protein
MAVVASAAAMTSAKLGSQRPSAAALTSRNASTLAGEIIDETVRPAPNRRPESKAAAKRAIA